MTPLRIVMAIFAIAMIGFGFFLEARNSAAIGATIWLGIIGLIILVAAFFERTVYKPVENIPPLNSQATGERFIDPQTGHLVEVYFDPVTGERTYVKASVDTGAQL